MLGALAVGRTTLRGLTECPDVCRTAAALAAMGAVIARHPDGIWTVDGIGIGGLMEPDRVLDLGGSATGVRLLMGLAATHPMTAVFTGDASLNRQPMAGLITPLERIGAQFIGRAGFYLPLTVTGAVTPIPIEYELTVASAEIKSAILLAGLNIPGRTTVIEAVPTHDHGEHLLRGFGAKVAIEPLKAGGRRIAIDGQPELGPQALDLPGDFSSGAFPLVAALLAEGSDLTLTGIGLNPLRTGLLDTLLEMGAQIEITNGHVAGEEPVGDLRVRATRLRGIAVPAERAARLSNEYPILAIAAACAEGRTVMHGLDALGPNARDRLAALARGLARCGVKAGIEDGALTIDGAAGPPPGGARLDTGPDHRAAMAFLVLGLAARAPVELDDAAPIETEFPDFTDFMRRLGADIGDLHQDHEEALR